MKSSQAALLSLAIALTFAPAASAQRPRAVSSPPGASAPPQAPAPQSAKAKYEGGMIGYRKAEGFVAFDDVNRRLVFQDKQRREVFPVGYDVMLAIWADTKSQTSTAGRVIAGTAPYGLGLPALLLRDKSRYLVIRYSDPDTGAEGLTSFKLESKEMLQSFLHTLAQKAELTARGDAYIRRKTPADDKAKQTTSPD
ncbi:MAG TPA: hypothetical protein VEY09_02840 [Pyrinomonadaceae bacterium]|nr:hypothetical protein [Pyrinomonadaceae bacterium]